MTVHERTDVMAATFHWNEDNGVAAGAPAKGTTRTVDPVDANWKAVDDAKTAGAGTAYSASSIVAGQNSFEKFQFGVFSGAFNQILNGKWAHTAGVLGANMTLKGKVGPIYTTPSQAANALLDQDMTPVIAIGAGQAVQFGATGPEAAGKAASSVANPSYTQYLATQLQTAAGAAAGDTAVATLTLSYDEN